MVSLARTALCLIFLLTETGRLHKNADSWLSCKPEAGKAGLCVHAATVIQAEELLRPVGGQVLLPSPQVPAVSPFTSHVQLLFLTRFSGSGFVHLHSTAHTDPE